MSLSAQMPGAFALFAGAAMELDPARFSELGGYGLVVMGIAWLFREGMRERRESLLERQDAQRRHEEMMSKILERNDAQVTRFAEAMAANSEAKRAIAVALERLAESMGKSDRNDQ